MKSTDSINKEYFKNEHPRKKFAYGMFLFYFYTAILFMNILAVGFSDAIKHYDLIISFFIFFIPAIWCTYKFCIFFSYKQASLCSPSRILWENERQRRKKKLSDLYNKYLGWYLRPIVKGTGAVIESACSIAGAALKIIGLIIGIALIPFAIDVVDAISSGCINNKTRFEKYTEEVLKSYCRSVVLTIFEEHVSSKPNNDSFQAFHASNWSTASADYKIYFAGYAPQDLNCQAKIYYSSTKEYLSPKAIVEFELAGPLYVPKPYSNVNSFRLSMKRLNNLYPTPYAKYFSYRDYMNRHPTLGEIMDNWHKKWF